MGVFGPAEHDSQVRFALSLMVADLQDKNQLIYLISPCIREIIGRIRLIFEYVYPKISRSTTFLQDTFVVYLTVAELHAPNLLFLHISPGIALTSSLIPMVR